MKKNAEPTALVLDSQSVKNSATATEKIGFDGGKLIKGRKRFVLADTSGATVAVQVLPANAHDGQSVGWSSRNGQGAKVGAEAGRFQTGAGSGSPGRSGGGRG
ncbi:MAG: transposase [Janthinobacterium lividum]